MGELAQQLGKLDGCRFFTGNNHIIMPGGGIGRENFAHTVAQAAFNFIARHCIATMFAYREPNPNGAAIVGDALHAKAACMLLAATLGAQKICPR